MWKGNSENIETYFKNPFSDFNEIEKLFKGE